jgi:hypothetical protein
MLPSLVRLALSIGLLTSAVACDSKSSADAPGSASRPEHPGPERVRSDLSENSQASEPKPEAKPEPPVFTLEPGVAAPAQSVMLAAARSALGGKLAVAAPVTGFGLRRHVTALRRSEPGDEQTFSLHAVVFEASEADGAEASWSVVASQELHRWSTLGLEDEKVGTAPTTIVADDFDDDGEAELLVRVRLDTMCPGGGPNTITHLIIADFAPTSAIALRTELHHSMIGDAQTKATVAHEDLDGDGHRDVRVRYVSTDSDPASTETAENRWLWVAGEDEWVRASATVDAALPSYDRFGCDW